MKQKILRLIWNTLCNMDKGERYSYETAPYCGHHYSGFENRYIKSDCHEGFGYGETKVSFLGYKIVAEIDFRTTFHLTKKS
jgi:hypothetical protein